MGHSTGSGCCSLNLMIRKVRTIRAMKNERRPFSNNAYLDAVQLEWRDSVAAEVYPVWMSGPGHAGWWYRKSASRGLGRKAGMAVGTCSMGRGSGSASDSLGTDGGSGGRGRGKGQSILGRGDPASAQHQGSAAPAD